MANRWAVQNGNWSSPSTWDGGISIPGPGDVVGANTYTVTIDQDVSVAEIKTTAVGSGAAGGTFSVAVTSGTRTINGNVTAGTTTCLTASISAGATLVINGTCTSGSSGASHGISASGAGNMVVAVQTGDVCRGNAGTGNSVYNSLAGTLSIFGNITPGQSNGHCVVNASTGSVAFTGNVTGSVSGSAAYGIYNSSIGTVTIVGNVSGASYNGAGAYNGSFGTIAIIGNVFGGGLNGPAGVVNASTGSITITGTVTGQTGVGCSSSTNGTLRITGNCYANPAPAVQWTGPASYVEVNGDQYGGVSGAAQGSMAVVAYKQAFPASANYLVRGAQSNGNGGFSGNTAYLYGAARGPFGHPSAANVRYGIQYGPSNELTGTCHVPEPQSVLYGVPVDDTTGTVTITSSDIASAVWGANRDDYKDAGTFGAVDEWASTVTVNDIADGIADKEVDTGVSVKKALEMLAAFMAGKVTASSSNGVTTYSYKKRDGTTVSFTSVCSEEDGTRATTGGLS